MSFIKSISGFRGTIGGIYGENLTPIDIVESAAAYGTWLIKNKKNDTPRVVIGRDARISGSMVSGLVSQTLIGLGIDVIDAGLSTTPTVEMAVIFENADGGIILTASHNPMEWNALKLLNHKGEFISGADGAEILETATSRNIQFATVEKLGKLTTNNSFIEKHIAKILELPLVNVEKIRESKFKVVVDVVNSTGAISIVPLLKALECTVILINGEMNGKFAHNPEPLPENLTELANAVLHHRAHLGIAVDPDVDRLALISEDGDMFGEEYTLVAVADYILKKTPGNTVSNMSSTRALKDITERHKGNYAASAVGEVNVVEKMKETNAVIGGEGNGGIIYPELHYGRDALVGIAFILSSLAEAKVKSLSLLRSMYPRYSMSKNKFELGAGFTPDEILNHLHDKYSKTAGVQTNTIDGLKLDFKDGNWLHIRKSNTEPIVRVYSESTSQVVSNNLIKKIFEDIKEFTQR